MFLSIMFFSTHQPPLSSTKHPTGGQTKICRMDGEMDSNSKYQLIFKSCTISLSQVDLAIQN